MNFRTRLLVFLALLLPLGLLADDSSLTVEVHGVPLSKRVHWLLDFSGSMNMPKRDRLISIWHWAMQQCPDDAAVKVSIFDTGLRTYDRKWTQMPDKKAFDLITGWVRSQPSGGGTNIGHAIYYSTLQNYKDEEVFDLFLITDGLNTCGDFEGQFKAARAIATPAIHSIGIGLGDHNPEEGYELLVGIAEETEGMFISDNLPEVGQGF